MKFNKFKNMLVTLGVASGITLAGIGVANADTVTVQPGDTLSKIAVQYNTTVDSLAQLNHIADVNMIMVGQQLQTGTNANVNVNTGNNTQVANKVSATVPAPAPVKAQTNTNTNTNAQTQVESNTPAITNNTDTNESTNTNTTNNGSVHDQFIANGGTEEMWDNIVLPESGGNPNASNGKYHGLGQMGDGTGNGSVAQQTQGMINYATSRYGSVQNAVAFRQAHGWW